MERLHTRYLGHAWHMVMTILEDISSSSLLLSTCVMERLHCIQTHTCGMHVESQIYSEREEGEGDSGLSQLLLSCWENFPEGKWQGNSVEKVQRPNGKSACGSCPDWGSLPHGKPRGGPLTAATPFPQARRPPVQASPTLATSQPLWLCRLAGPLTFLSKAAWRPCWVAMVTGSLPAGLPG